MTESPATCLRCGFCLLDLTRVKSGRACLPRQARQPRQPDRRAPIYQQLNCGASLACRLAASSNRVGRSPTGGPLIRPSDPRRRVNAGERVIVKHGSAAFIGTGLEADLREAGFDSLVLAGGAAKYCVDSTARMAGNLGFSATVVSDALLNFQKTLRDGRVLPATDDLAMTLANLSGAFATIQDTDAVLADLPVS